VGRGAGFYGTIRLGASYRQLLGSNGRAAGGSYTVGELVTYQGSEYKCVQANHDAAPNWDPIDWAAWHSPGKS
jgi:hypothetical protein